MLSRKALCVGINQYQYLPSVGLQGCVNDALAMTALLKDLLGFEDADITLLTDQAATKANIMQELRRMVESALAGRTNHLVFTFAGLGTLVPDLSPDEFDRADEAYCPYDVVTLGSRWDRDRLLVDDELHDLLVQLPSSVLLEVFLDTCHSGNRIGAADLLLDRRPRFLPPPSIPAFRELELRRARPAHQKLLEKGLSHHILWTACKENQIAAEAFLHGDWQGAFTWHLCREARASGNRLSRAQVLARVRLDLRDSCFTQTPQLDCEAFTRHEALKAMRLPPELAPLPAEMPT